MEKEEEMKKALNEMLHKAYTKYACNPDNDLTRMPPVLSEDIMKAIEGKITIEEISEIEECIFDIVSANEETAFIAGFRFIFQLLE